jgi:RND family efflux transporter MFP subunit
MQRKQAGAWGPAISWRIALAVGLCGLPVCSRAATIEGFIEPYRKIDVAPAEPGTITTIDVQEGDAVTKGQLLAALDCDVLQITLEMAKASMDSKGRYDSAMAERNLRAKRLAKLEELRPRGHASQEEVDRARTDCEVAEANLLSVKEQHELDELEYKKTQAMIERRTLRSPIDGVVTRVYREQREYVAPNAPTVLTVVQLNPLRVVFSIPTAQAATMTIGHSLPLSLPDTGAKAEGRVEFISPVTDADSGTVRVKVLLNNDQGEYRCGVRCALDLPEPAHLTETLSLPPVNP